MSRPARRLAAVLVALVLLVGVAHPAPAAAALPGNCPWQTICAWPGMGYTGGATAISGVAQRCRFVAAHVYNRVASVVNRTTRSYATFYRTTNCTGASQTVGPMGAVSVMSGGYDGVKTVSVWG